MKNRNCKAYKVKAVNLLTVELLFDYFWKKYKMEVVFIDISETNVVPILEALVQDIGIIIIHYV